MSIESDSNNADSLGAVVEELSAYLDNIQTDKIDNESDFLKLLNILEANYLSNKRSSNSLRSIALLSKAIRKGSLLAKRIRLNIDRWDRDKPAQLSSIPIDEDRLFVIDKIKKSKGEWLLSYMMEVAFGHEYSEKVNKKAASIIFEICKDIGLLVGSWSSVNSGKNLEKIIDFLTKNATRFNTVSANLFASEYEMLTIYFIENAELLYKDKKILNKDIEKLAKILEAGVSLQPLLVFNHSIIRALTALYQFHVKMKGKSDKFSMSLFYLSAELSISCIESGAFAHPEQYLESTMYLLGVIDQKKYPHIKELILRLSAISNRNDLSKSTSINSIQDAIAHLYGSLRDWESKHKPVDISAVWESVNSLMVGSGVELIGARDEKVRFDPIIHYVHEVGRSPVEYVVIDLPGIGGRRENGSLRVITKPIVRVV